VNLDFKGWMEVDKILDDDELCMYFTMGDDIFGAPEESRLIFAKVKDPKDEDRGSLKDAMFGAIDLLRSMAGEKTARLFSMKDVPKIKVIDKKELASLLRRKKK
jgi:hypothetical protein